MSFLNLGPAFLYILDQAFSLCMAGCGEAFVKKTQLRQHMIIQHGAAPRYQCGKCARASFLESYSHSSITAFVFGQ